MKWTAWFVPVLLIGMLTLAQAADTQRPMARQAAFAQKRGLPWLKLKVAQQPLKTRLDQLRLKYTMIAPIMQPTPPPPQEAAVTVTLGAQVTAVPGAYVFANGLSLWAGGALPVEGIAPSIEFNPTGSFFILYSLTGTQNKDIIIECTGGPLPAMMAINGYAITNTSELGSVSMTVSTTQNKTKVKALIDPSDIGSAPWLLIELEDSDVNESWRLTSCTVEKK
jgi:hypothetical protein